MKKATIARLIEEQEFDEAASLLKHHIREAEIIDPRPYLVGALAESGDLSLAGLQRALLVGSVTASFTVEAFSMNRLREIDRAAIGARCEELERVAGWTRD